MNRFVLRQSLLLFLAAFIWGSAFVAQSVGMDYLGPYSFNAIRMCIGSLVLVPLILIRAYVRKKNFTENSMDPSELAVSRKRTILTGMMCGCCLAAGSILQQVGIQYTTAAKAGFLTAMYIVLVPIASVFLGRKPSYRVWIGVVMSAIGLYLLSIRDGFTLAPGDGAVILCAFAYCIHILLVDHFGTKVDSIQLSSIQFATCSVISAIFMLFSGEQVTWTAVSGATVPLLYTGVLSCGVAFTLQIVGQKGMNPTAASLIMCLESVISAVAGFVILHEVMTNRELAGCIMMFAAIILVQLPVRRQEKSNGSDSGETEYHPEM